MRISPKHGVRRLALIAVASLAVVIMASGCAPRLRHEAGLTASSGAATAIPVGSSDHVISVDGITYRPAALPERAPLVVMMHGGFGNANWAERSYHWNAEADAGHFVVADPDGLHRAWNAGGGCCGMPSKANVNDIGFITAMVSAIEHALPVDANRIYAAGMSNGGSMAYTLACHTTIFAAIGPDSATQLGSCPNPPRTSVIAIHGTADGRVPYYGGEGDGPAHIDGPSIPAVNAAWRRTDHCASPVITTAGTVTTSLANCPAGRSVELISIAGAGHQWPDSRPNPLARLLLHTDPPSTALNATHVIWEFFAAHAR